MQILIRFINDRLVVTALSVASPLSLAISLDLSFWKPICVPRSPIWLPFLWFLFLRFWRHLCLVTLTRRGRCLSVPVPSIRFFFFFLVSTPNSLYFPFILPLSLL